MRDRLPKRPQGRRICIICEGDEDFDYIQRLRELRVWSNKYSIVPRNAGSIDNIFSRYQIEYQVDDNELVVIFCDTDDSYATLKQNIEEFHDKQVANYLIYYANPCTMQIFLSHFSKGISLKTADKSKNSPLIKKLTGVEEYRATEQQRKHINKKISPENYVEMKNNIEPLRKKTYTDVPSSNFYNLLVNLESDETSWIDEINNYLD